MVLLPASKSAVVVLCAADRGAEIDRLAFAVAAALTPAESIP